MRGYVFHRLCNHACLYINTWDIIALVHKRIFFVVVAQKNKPYIINLCIYYCCIFQCKKLTFRRWTIWTRTRILIIVRNKCGIFLWFVILSSVFFEVRYLFKKYACFIVCKFDSILMILFLLFHYNLQASTKWTNQHVYNIQITEKEK